MSFKLSFSLFFLLLVGAVYIQGWEMRERLDDEARQRREPGDCGSIEGEACKRKGFKCPANEPCRDKAKCPRNKKCCCFPVRPDERKPVDSLM